MRRQQGVATVQIHIPQKLDFLHPQGEVIELSYMKLKAYPIYCFIF